MLILSPHQLLFSSTLFLGIFITVSSSSWFMLWMGLELNLMSFVPILTSTSNRYSAESALKYFLIQALGSAFFLGAAPISMLMYSFMFPIILMVLLLKMGAAPFHFWFPPVMQGIQWPQALLLMTIQKIAPISMMSVVLSGANSIVVIMASIFSSLVGGLSGLNQTLTRKILSYSSINHMGWMLGAITFNEPLWIIYFSSYSIVSSSVVFILHSNQIFHINQILVMNLFSKPLKLSLFLSLLSLGGLPPLLGFLPKMMVIQEFINSKASLLWLSILLLSALLTLFFYLRVAVSSFMLSYPKMKMNMSPTQPRLTFTMSFINLSPLLYPLVLIAIY
uniref:NADH-ubiquinone oxidoreductase chain 2 n=1 Tax=Stygiocaris lancifera TaxID=481991 RepID=A0A1Z2R730_STYLA|nr:NADH dehydrogenase subunit 2 [Stygiocaris lancifera]ASA39515.1 NADH dehydrogenase subunit 2 [Stygiocaris lancifera]